MDNVGAWMLITVSLSGGDLVVLRGNEMLQELKVTLTVHSQ